MSAALNLKPAKLNNSVAVEIVGLNKWYGDFHVLRDINLNVKGGERIVICGPSGSGKSTMIRCINRLEEHQQGRLVVDGIELTNDLKKIELHILGKRLRLIQVRRRIIGLGKLIRDAAHSL